MRPVQLAPSPPADDKGKLQWLLDRVTQLCNASQVDSPVDVAAENEDTYQPLDDDLTAIAALATTTFGRSLLTQANAGALVSLLSLVIGTNTQAWDALLDSLAALADPNADRAVFWDDSAGALAWLAAASGLEIDGTDLRMTTNQRTSALVWEIDGGGAPVTAGYKGSLLVPFACTIVGATLLADQSGSIVVDIYKAAYGSYVPNSMSSIVASAFPTLSSATKYQDTTLTGWTTAIAANDTLQVGIGSASTLTRCTIILNVVKT